MDVNTRGGTRLDLPIRSGFYDRDVPMFCATCANWYQNKCMEKHFTHDSWSTPLCTILYMMITFESRLGVQKPALEFSLPLPPTMIIVQVLCYNDSTKQCNGSRILVNTAKDCKRLSISWIVCFVRASRTYQGSLNFIIIAGNDFSLVLGYR